MKALTLTQPWATFVASGLKLIETRNWSTPHRGWLAIHAAKGFPPWAKDLCVVKPFNFWLDKLGCTVETLPLGAVIAKVNMIDCVRFTITYDPPSHEAQFGDFTPGRYGFIFSSVVTYPKPIPAKGSLGLWNWTPPAA